MGGVRECGPRFKAARNSSSLPSNVLPPSVVLQRGGSYHSAIQGGSHRRDVPDVLPHSPAAMRLYVHPVVQAARGTRSPPGSDWRRSSSTPPLPASPCSASSAEEARLSRVWRQRCKASVPSGASQSPTQHLDASAQYPLISGLAEGNVWQRRVSQQHLITGLAILSGLAVR